MNEPRKGQTPRHRDHKALLSTLKMTTTIGAVSLTLAGWGLLSRVEAQNVAQAAQASPASFISAAPSSANPAAVASSPSVAQSGFAPTATVLPRATAVPTFTPTVQPTTSATTDVPTATPTPLFKLNVVQWLQNQAGDPVAVVQDNQGTLWYVMGSDIPLIENGQQPQYQPQPVNAGGRTRRS
jgi:hypothetical protein